MRKYRSSEIVADYLVEERIPCVLGVCGHGDVEQLDALYDRADPINLICVRHEQATGQIADAYFRIRHRPLPPLAAPPPGSVGREHGGCT